MHKRARIASVSGMARLAGMAVLSLCGTEICQAQEGHDSGNSAENKGTWHIQSNAELASNFDERWNASDNEFVLGADGIAKRPGDTPQTSQTQQKMNHIDAALGSPASSDDTINTAGPTGSLTQFGASNMDDSSSDGVTECGRSPLNAEEIKALVVQTARKHGVDPEFATAIAWAESGFDRIRNSPKGARGAMQLIPATAARFGVMDICDPAQNIEGGIKYLRFLLDEFQNPLLAAAAYNSGEQRIYEYGGIPPFQETVGYVAKVVNYQLGLPMPSAKGKARRTAGQAVSAANDDGDAGVIAVKKNGTFVGGVMHF